MCSPETILYLVCSHKRSVIPCEVRELPDTMHAVIGGAKLLDYHMGFSRMTELQCKDTEVAAVAVLERVVYIFTSLKQVGEKLCVVRCHLESRSPGI